MFSEFHEMQAAMAAAKEECFPGNGAEGAWCIFLKSAAHGSSPSGIAPMFKQRSKCSATSLPAQRNRRMAESSLRQYTFRQIIAIWAMAALPMGLLGWVVNPLVAQYIDPRLGITGIARVLLMLLGLIWQFALAMMIVKHEENGLTRENIVRRLWLNAPRNPTSGTPQRVLWLWAAAFVVLVAVLELVFVPISGLDKFWISLFPFLAEPPQYSIANFFSSPQNRASLTGAWWVLALFLLLGVFNTFLGEELLFRGVLLPKMQGVFGSWDWVANGVLFSAYHLHQPWGIPGGIVVGVLAFALPARLFRSTWMSIIVHSTQTVFFAIVLLLIVLGVA